MQYQIDYYSEVVRLEVDALPLTLRVRYASLTQRMLEFGPDLGEPHTKALGAGLLEMRLKGAEGIARVLYCTMAGRRIVVLHSFIKKTDKIPAKDLNLARNRLKELKK
ncbi:MAG TPA: type II toxin-antitoxin system RelE/ParE family toxin [Giesbergeria sp.]|nr:type II toxin-antitoxin system RelE/ParE family toxin [Giesbergeria sp.]HQY39364.1 type II toxin-antitoxin system RelE/ParE family toxin [Giesbergeria sp.]HRA13954.1 type II toxin-antitoxin system RelE/ParE family toxin [Giesbergeria sp.]